MNCTSTNQLLDDYERGLLDAKRRSAISVHLDNCAACRDELLEHRQYLRVMQGFLVPDPKPGQLAHMLRLARLQDENSVARGVPDQSFFKGFATAFALAAMGFVGAAQFWGPLEQANSPQSAPAIAETGLVRDITVVINVPADMPAANLALYFPEPLRLQGLEELRHVAWPVDLQQGANVLTLPLTIKPGTNLTEPLSIAARVSYHDKEKDFQLPVEVRTPQNSRHGASLSPDDLPQYHI